MTLVDKKSFYPLRGVHDRKLCAGRPCVLHNPSYHRLNDAPLDWELGEGLRRVCAHGTFHADPDVVEYRVEVIGDSRRKAADHDCWCHCCYYDLRGWWRPLAPFHLWRDAKDHADFMDYPDDEWIYNQFDGIMYLRAVKRT